MENLSKCFCLSCRGHFENEQDFDTHGCNQIFKMIQGNISVELSNAINLKRTRWGRFVHKFYSLDWGWGLAFTGLIIINMILLPHFHLSFGLSLLESFSFGFVIPRLLK